MIDESPWDYYSICLIIRILFTMKSPDTMSFSGVLNAIHVRSFTFGMQNDIN